MRLRKREDDEGDDEVWLKVDGDLKTSNDSKSLMEMKEYLRSEFEKKIETRKHGEETYLHFAASLGDVDATKIFIADNVEVDAVDDEEWTALHWAALHGHLTLREC